MWSELSEATDAPGTFSTSGRTPPGAGQGAVAYVADGGIGVRAAYDGRQYLAGELEVFHVGRCPVFHERVGAALALP